MSRALARSSTAAALLAAAGALSLSFPAAAQSGSSAAAGRYTMQKTDDGFLRLDTQTGAVALCRKQEDGWGCRTIAGTDEGTGDGGGGGASAGAAGVESGTRGSGQGAEASEAERLRRENAELRDEVARLEELLGLRGEGPAPGANRHGFKLPSERDVDQAFDYFEGLLRKFQERLKKLEPDKPAEPAPERQL